MAIRLSEIEARVLGALMEKEAATPEYYPLSLNALLNACNQKSNRDPVMQLEEGAVREAFESLREKGLAGLGTTADSRVAKYEHRVGEAFNFTRSEFAIVCELFLRGAQTPGELRTRASRLHPLEDLAAVHSALEHLMRRQPPLVAVLPRQPGSRESRYMHLLCGEAPSPAPERAAAQAHGAGETSSNGDRLARLEAEVASLRAELDSLRREISSLRGLSS